MAIGSAIVLFVLGAILTYGVEVDVPGLDLGVIGTILMVAGAIGGAIGLILIAGRDRRRTTTTAQEVHPTADGGQVVQTEVRR